jgi:hypothetical protein
VAVTPIRHQRNIKLIVGRASDLDVETPSIVGRASDLVVQTASVQMEEDSKNFENPRLLSQILSKDVNVTSTEDLGNVEQEPNSSMF